MRLDNGAGMPFLRPISDRWVKPVRPGDTLSVRVTVLKAVPSKSKPDRGAVTSFVEVINQASEVVMTFKVVNIIAKRSPES